MRILVVGAGLAGAVYARCLADVGSNVTVIDRRDHVGGNCYDYRSMDGVLIHRYGPHFFHTNSPRVVEWLSQFTEWTQYSHRVLARLPDGRLAPFPVNRQTLEMVFGVRLRDESDARLLLADEAIECKRPETAAEYLNSRLGRRVTNIFFRPYNKKMWGLDLENIDASVVKRINIRLDDNDLYFPNDYFQAIPKNGYTSMFNRILSHERIAVYTNTPFENSLINEFDYTFSAMSIDEFFEYRYGYLSYRSLRFHLAAQLGRGLEGAVTINSTDESPFTRSTCWNNLPNQPVIDRSWITSEEPCDFRDNNFERYYPAVGTDGADRRLYALYAEDAMRLNNISFIGRCGTYQYLNMDQVVNQSLIGVSRFVERAHLA